MTHNPPIQSITLTFISYASIPFKIELYADNLVLDWGDGNHSEYNKGDHYYVLRYTYQKEGLQKLKISGTNISYLKAQRLCMTDLDVSDCPTLEYLDCSGNELLQLDLQFCPLLEELYCNSNNLSTFSLPENNKISLLNISYNNLQSLILRNNFHLQSLHCAFNQLNNIDLQGCRNLNDLNISNNNLQGNVLNRVFSDLPIKAETDYAFIHYISNPGFEDCNPRLLKMRNWH